MSEDGDELKRALKSLFKDKEFLKSISSSLDQCSTPSTSTGKRALQDSSPLRLKKVKLSTKALSREEGGAGLPNVVEKSLEPNDGTCDSSDSYNENILEQILGADSEEEFSEEEEGQFEEENETPRENSSDSEFEVLGAPPEGSWKVDKKVLNWFYTIADIELKKEDMDNLKKTYQTPKDLSSHFEPPKLPPTIWQTISQSNHADLFRLKHIHRAQDSLYLATRPLLSVLEKCDKSLRSELCSAIQLIASSNLLLNRYRRASILPHVKKELRTQIRNLPITHNSLFKEDFEKSADSLLKEQAALNKVLLPKKPPVQMRLGKQPNTAKSGGGSSFRGSSYRRGSFRGQRGRGRGRGKQSGPLESSSGSSTTGANSAQFA